MQQLETIDINVILVYLAGLLVLGYYIGQKQHTDKDYFFGGGHLLREACLP